MSRSVSLAGAWCARRIVGVVMGRPRTFNEIDEAMSFFPTASHKKVQGLIERATPKELKANRARTKAKLLDRSAQRLAQTAICFVAKQLTGVLSLRAAAPRQTPSIKQKAPDVRTAASLCRPTCRPRRSA